MALILQCEFRSVLQHRCFAAPLTPTDQTPSLDLRIRNVSKTGCATGVPGLLITPVLFKLYFIFQANYRCVYDPELEPTSGALLECVHRPTRRYPLK